MNQNFTQLFELSTAEKLQLVEDLWDDIAQSPEEISVLDWQKQELRNRKENYLNNPNSGDSWEIVKERIRSNSNGK